MWYKKCRHPHTTQERRENGRRCNGGIKYYDEEIVIYVRASRSFYHLPNVWDELWRGDMLDRNWKRFRKHQYRVK
jgi:hypothetical protein